MMLLNWGSFFGQIGSTSNESYPRKIQLFFAGLITNLEPKNRNGRGKRLRAAGKIYIPNNFISGVVWRVKNVGSQILE